jgi:hypothetical protein
VAQKAADLLEEATDDIFNHIFSGVYYGTQHKEKQRHKAGKATSLNEKIPCQGTHRSKSVGTAMGGGQGAPTNFSTVFLTPLSSLAYPLQSRFSISQASQTVN